MRVICCKQLQPWDGVSADIPAYIEIICDDESELPASPNSIVSGFVATIGSTAHVVSNQLDYEMQTDGTWVQKQSQDLVSIVNALSSLDVEVSTLDDNINSLYGVVGNIKDAVSILVDDVKNKVVLTTDMSTTSNGITFTVNSNGTITLTGVATATAFFSAPISFPSGSYMFSGMPTDGGSSTFRQELRATPAGAVYQVNDTELPSTFERTTSYSGYYSIRVASGFNCGAGFTLEPMIAPESLLVISPSFKAGAPTNRELYELIRGYHP